MKKVLFVDYIWQPGHVNFNKMHIDALKAAGADVKLILYRSMKEQLTYQEDDYAMVIPDFIRMRQGYPILNRIGFLIVLSMIRLRLSLSKFDYVYVASFDELTLGIIPLGKRMLLVAHDNAKGIAYKTKRYFLHRLSKLGTFIVFSNYMLTAFVKNGINNVKIVSHGCMDASSFEIMNLSFSLDKYSLVIFQASAKMDKEFYYKIINNKTFCNFIRTKNILLILRNSQIPTALSENAISINRYLLKKEYNALMKKANIVLLAYPETFKYQVSGVSFECVALKKCMAMYMNPSLMYCRDFYNYNPFFSDVSTFTGLLSSFLNGKDNKCVVKAQYIKPDYSKIL